MKHGLIYCVYGDPENIEPVISPWIAAKKEFDIEISVVHGQFKEYHELGYEDNDLETLAKLKKTDFYDHLYCQNDYWLTSRENFRYQTEAEIRDHGAQYLLGRNCDVLMLLDNDEIYTLEEIRNIFKYIRQRNNKGIACFSVHLKNYIFDGKQWIDGFHPPRIFRVNFGDALRLKRCYHDNAFEYTDQDGNLIKHGDLPNKEIPRRIAHVKHLTWLHSNGKRKFEYQMRRFGACSYRWNYETHKLEFNSYYYKKRNIPFPEVYFDES